MSQAVEQQLVASLSNPDQIQALAQPVRGAVLEALREVDSAAGVARAIGGTRQLVNYHLKELARLGLVRHAGERRKGNFMEQLYQAVARRFVVAPEFSWNAATLADTLRDQVSLAELASLGDRLQRDAAGLIDRAATGGEQIASASVMAEVRFADEQARSAFMTEYLQVLRALLSKHAGADGEPYRVLLAAYPEAGSESRSESEGEELNERRI